MWGFVEIKAGALPGFFLGVHPKTVFRISKMLPITNSAQRFRSGAKLFKKVPGFRSISSIYYYSSVSYGQKMTTLFRQFFFSNFLNAGG